MLSPRIEVQDSLPYMELFSTFTLLLIFSALFAYINSRWIRLPQMCAFMLGSILVSVVLLILQALHVPFAEEVIIRLRAIDFSRTVLYGILSFLLFAGALQFNIKDLAREKWVILVLATAGVVISTFIVGLIMYGVYGVVGIGVSLAYALLFGALISPTDPVIIISILKGAKTNQPLKMKIMGEALFNDGIAIALFTTLLAFAEIGPGPGPVDTAVLLARQLFGSLVLGLVIGWIIHRLLSHVDAFTVQVLLTFGLVAGGYDAALLLGTSGPLTVVIAGLFVRNYRSKKDKPAPDFSHLYRFWGMIDELLNAALFIMMGLEVLTMPYTKYEWIAGIIAIFVVLLGRWISVAIPIGFFRLFRPFTKNVVGILTWAGLRGGISLALALSLPTTEVYYPLLCATYLTVLFSTIAQGLTVKKILHVEN